jgi:hypothetical protein
MIKEESFYQKNALLFLFPQATVNENFASRSFRSKMEKKGIIKHLRISDKNNLFKSSVKIFTDK